MENQPISRLIQVLGINDFNKPEILINKIVADSRQVTPGSLFVAITGEKADGHFYISDAVQRGSSAIIGTRPDVSCPVPYIQVSDGRKALALLSAAFYDFPARKMQMIGVTGTDGKTTTSNLIYSILKHAGIKSGMVTTVNARIGDEVIDTGFHVTTPEAPEIQRFLAQMVSSGFECAIIETTSHGLEQKRVTGCDFDIGVLTNITHEHLDYHGTFENYRNTKAELFRHLSNPIAKKRDVVRGAVLNRDDESYSFLEAITYVDIISYGRSRLADIREENQCQTRGHLSFNIVSDRFGKLEQSVHSTLIGSYNISNILAAVATTVGFMGVSIEDARLGIENTPAIPGRMERIELGQNFLAIVDFAHTPNALTKTLATIRNILSVEEKKGRIIAIFGSAGLRDRLKRKMMAEISAQYADITILTAEDPRTESLEYILGDMKSGMEAKGGEERTTYWIIPDRGEAIQFGVELAEEDDIVVVCGKGHEQSMCFGEIEYPWDDRTALRAAIALKSGIEGPEMPYLPTTRRVD